MNAPLPPDPYKALGVDIGADAASIKTAYRKLVLRCHPDKVLDPALKAVKQEEFQKVQQAYEILSDEDKRREYDLEVKARKLREELYKSGTAASTPPKKYYNVNIRTAEPPASYTPAPQPPTPASKTYNPYSGGSPHFSSSWERDMPSRSKGAYEEPDRKARRAPSYEKPPREEEPKEERRRRKDLDREREEQYLRDKERERERERERDREREPRDRKREKEKERERERDRKEEKERDRAVARAEKEQKEKEALKAEKKRQERERDKERDRARRRDQEEKHRSKSKPVYVEPYSESDDEHAAKAKKASATSKKHSDSPSRDKASRRDRSPSRKDVNREDKTHNWMSFAADYMDQARRKGSKSGPTHGYPEQTPSAYPAAYPDPDDAWHGSTQPPRRGSHDAKYAAKADPVIVDGGSPSFKGPGPDSLNVSPAEGGRPPRLQKSYTSPVGGMPTSQAPPPPRVPGLGRSQTMQPEYGRSSGPPPAPAAPAPDKYTKHTTERRRRNSFDAFEEEEPPRGHYRSGKGAKENVRVYYVNEEETPRVVEGRYRDPYEYSSAGAAAQFPKVKVAPRYGPEQVYTSKRYNEDDVTYTRPSQPYTQQYAY